MSAFYIAALDHGLQDFRSALGPFGDAKKAAAKSGRLVSNERSPKELAEIGNFFVMEVTGGPLNCVIGPFATQRQARDVMKECKEMGGCFLNDSAAFVGIVRYIKQDGRAAPQIAILEACERR